MLRWSQSAYHAPTLRRCEADPASSGVKRLLEVADDVVLVLDADREPDHVGAGAGLHLLRIAKLAMGGRRWMDDQRTSVTDVGEVREQFYIRHEFHAGVIPA